VSAVDDALREKDDTAFAIAWMRSSAR
jgi:hypothetical protein